MSFIVAATVIGGGAVLGAGLSYLGSQQAAGAAENAQGIQAQEFNTITQQEQPYMQGGYGALSDLNYLLGIGKPGTVASAGTNGAPGTPGTASSSTAGGYGSLLQPFNVNDWKKLSPSYNFQLQQGGQGVLNADSSSEGALSGAAMKDLISFNQQTANESFSNAFNMYQTQQSNIYSRLANIAQLGQTSAANTGQQGTALAGNEGSAAVAAGNAIGTGISNVGNSLGNAGSQYAWLSTLANAGG